MLFCIEDERHGEPGASFATRQEALSELRRLAALPWNVPPNQAPCSGWESCGRRYLLVEYDERTIPWRLMASVAMLDVSEKGVMWLTPG